MSRESDLTAMANATCHPACVTCNFVITAMLWYSTPHARCSSLSHIIQHGQQVNRSGAFT